MFTKIGHILPETLQKNDLAPKVARAQALTAFEDAARQRLPATPAPAFKSLHLTAGTLTVACKSSAVARMLREVEAELLAAVNEAGGGIEQVRFLLAPWR